jgi:hypothetical protein
MRLEGLGKLERHSKTSFIVYEHKIYETSYFKVSFTPGYTLITLLAFLLLYVAVAKRSRLYIRADGGHLEQLL